MGLDAESGFLYALAPYSDRVPHPIHFALASSMAPRQVEIHGKSYEVSFSIHVEALRGKQFTLLLGIGVHQQAVEESLSRCIKAEELLESVRRDWNNWFDREIPRFRSSNPYFEELHYYRWWSLYTGQRLPACKESSSSHRLSCT